MSFPKLQRVEVEWQDAYGIARWDSLEEHKARTTAPIKSIGYLVTRDRDKITIVQSVGDSGSCADSLTIPKGWVVKVTKI